MVNRYGSRHRFLVRAIDKYSWAMPRLWWTVGPLAVTALVLLSGCTASTPVDPSPPEASAASSEAPQSIGVPATWQIANSDAVGPDSTNFRVEVTRLECASGVTGTLLDPVVVYEPDQIIIQIDAEPREAAVATCQGNNSVPVTIELTEPIGQRTLIDGACVNTSARETAPCDTSVRASFQG